jgi:hypothetical protein
VRVILVRYAMAEEKTLAEKEEDDLPFYFLANIGKIKECDYLILFSSLLRAEKRKEKQK